MTVRRHRRVAAHLLVGAVLLVGLIGFEVPGVGASLPRATPYRVGGPITLDTNLLSVSGVSAWAIDEYLAATTPLPPLGAAFLAAEQQYGVNARFLLAVALHESGWGRSYIARVKRNLFGYNAFDRNPGRYATAFETYEANVDATARFIKDWYLTRGGRWWGGQPTLRSMEQFWSTSGSWGTSISRMATSIRLASLAGRSITFAAPAVQGPLHGGDEAVIDLVWKGGALPAGIGVVARWEPLELDSEVVADAVARIDPADAELGGGVATAAERARLRPLAALSTGAAAEPSLTSADTSRPAAVAARASTAEGGSIRLGFTAPAEPGRYLLDIDLRDAGGTPLPAAEQLDVPSVEARVWGDRAVSYDVDARPDGSGAVVRFTNMGRVPIEWPVVGTLLPGASVAFDAPRLGSANSGIDGWLSVSMRTIGDVLGLAGSQRRDVALHGSTESAPGRTAADDLVDVSPVGPPTGDPVALPPDDVVSPDRSESPIPPLVPVTRAYSEHDPAIAYQGRWGDAASSGYVDGSVSWSKTPGATATFTFNGGSVRWMGPAGPTRGRAVVSIDGEQVARVDLWRSSFVARAVLFERTFPTAGSHTLTIEVLSTPNHPYVAIDGFIVDF